MEKPDPIPRKKSARLAIYRSRPQRSRTLELSALAVAAVGDSSNFSAAGYSLWSLRCETQWAKCLCLHLVVSFHRCAGSRYRLPITPRSILSA